MVYFSRWHLVMHYRLTLALGQPFLLVRMPQSRTALAAGPRCHGHVPAIGFRMAEGGHCPFAAGPAVSTERLCGPTAACQALCTPVGLPPASSPGQDTVKALTKPALQGRGIQHLPPVTVTKGKCFLLFGQRKSAFSLLTASAHQWAGPRTDKTCV